jgi:hypothetical protein
MPPTARREFRPQTPVRSFLRLYQHGGTPQAVRLNATIRDIADRIVFDQITVIDAAAFSRTGSADYTLDLPVSKLDAGDHLLTIDAQLGDRAISRESRFTVR